MHDHEFYVVRSLLDLKEPVSRGRFDLTGTRDEKRVKLDRPCEGRYVRFRALSEPHANPYASVAELIILHGQ
jgi:hypothetical protein